MTKANKYRAQAAPSPDPVIRVMPLVEELIAEDLMPLIRQVIVKRIGLYLREVKLTNDQRKTPNSH